MANSKHIEWLREGVNAWNERRNRGHFIPDLRNADIPEVFGEGGVESEIRRMISCTDDAVKLSGIDLRNADLQSSDFTSVNLSNADLRFANLKGCNLNGANLTDANLAGADLRCCKFNWAQLQGAKMFVEIGMAEDFDDTSMSGPDFRGADLTDAILANRTLFSADLRWARLEGTNLFRTQPWKATLFSDEASNSETSTVRYSGTVEGVHCLLKECSNIRDKHSDHVLYFRGEAEKFPELRPSLMRKKDGSFVHFRSEANMLVDLMSRRPEEFGNLISALGQWVLAQHHGLPTRLLDITRNPLVALFHACQERKEDSGNGAGRLHVFAVPKDLIKPFNSDSISVIANFAKLSCKEQKVLLGKRKEDTPDDVDPGDPQWAGVYEEAMGRLYHFIRQEKPHFQEKIDPRDFFRVFVVEPQQSFERIRGQSGAFLISGFHERFERSEIQKNIRVPVYEHFTLEVPEVKKLCILDELRLVNITTETLFPGLDEAAQAVTERYRKP